MVSRAVQFRFTLNFNSKHMFHIGYCCDHSREVDDRVVGQRYSANLPNRLVNWVAVTPALTIFTKKIEFILCWACVIVGHKTWSC